MQIDILTIFPAMFKGPFDESIIKRALDQGLVTIKVHDLRQWSLDAHHSVDDQPYGGGPGMVMLVEPIDRALITLCHPDPENSEGEGPSADKRAHVILTSAKGQLFTQAKAHQLAACEKLVFIAGRYEGVDQRVSDHLINEELSIGNYVLTGGELPVMVMIDSIVRLLPGVLGEPDSLIEESHNQPGYLEYPHYTRPKVYKGWSVPQVLLSGHHAQIQKWRRENSRHL